MKNVVENARTTCEKRASYNENSIVDNNYLSEWRNVRTLLSDSNFEDMLKEMNYTKSEFTYTLQPNENQDSCKADDWYQTFTSILGDFDYNKIDYDAGVHVISLPFSKFLLETLTNIQKQLNNVTVSIEVINAFIEAHLLELFNVSGKLVAAKLEKFKQKNVLKERSKKARFKEFLKRNFSSKGEYLDFFIEYPVAARLMTVRTIYLAQNFVDILKRIEQDSDEIKTFLEIEVLNLTNINLSTGDSHEQGKSVSILEFEDKKLVYKPKNLKVSEAFESFIDWYTTNSELLPIKIPKGIYKEKYTYNEFINRNSCRDENEISNFYTRYGYLIAICYLLGMNDLHMENIIADGEYPVIIDVETVFQNMPPVESPCIYSELLKDTQIETVASSCLLPSQLNVGVNDKVELSALKGTKAKLSKSFLAPTDINTDEFRYEKKPGYFEGGDNIPMLGENHNVDYQQYSLNIVEGFNSFVNFILNNKKECLKVVEKFKDLPIRVLLKGTERYGSMIRYSNHPNYNHEMKYRERLMMNIWSYPYSNKSIIKSEVRDLLFNDIPIFYSYTNSRDLIDSQGNIYSNYLSDSGFELALRRIKRLSINEIKKQETIMLFSLGLADCILNERKNMRKITFPKQKINFLNHAKTIADQLIENSLTKEKEASLISIGCDKDSHWKIEPCDETLHEGLSGVSVFFLEMYVRTKEEKYLSYYHKFIHAAVKQASFKGFESAFSGWLSPMYPLILEYRYLKTMSEKEYLELTLDKLEELTVEDIDRLTGIDYISGIAGVIRLLSAFQTTFNQFEISESVIFRFNKVFEDRLRLREDESVSNVGIAHGLCGIALAYMEDKNSHKISELLSNEYELKLVSTKTQKWCWGLSGMIQARLEILKYCPESIDHKQLDDLIEKFKNSLKKMSGSDTLCHGNGSVITTLKMLHEYTGDSQWWEILQLWMSNLHVNGLFSGYKIPEILGFESKGIFDGLSGIGWLYLYVSGTSNNLMLLESEY